MLSLRADFPLYLSAVTRRKQPPYYLIKDFHYAYNGCIDKGTSQCIQHNELWRIYDRARVQQDGFD
jgi:hypothetical protein